MHLYLISLRENILLATIKVHSSLHKYFDQTELRADFNTYHDLIPYLSAMHPKFKHYMDMVKWGESDESFAFLDKNLSTISYEELHIKRVHEDDVIYLAPVIIGGGGKKGGMLALVAVAGLAFMTGGASLAGTGTLAAGTTATGAGYAAAAGGGAMGASAAAAGYGGAASGGLFASFGGMGGFAMSLMGNIGMALLSSLFAKKPKENETDTSTRSGGAFGSLANSTKSGTPIALHYGLVRVAGQMLSGYVDSDDHGKNDVIKVEDKF